MNSAIENDSLHWLTLFLQAGCFACTTWHPCCTTSWMIAVVGHPYFLRRLGHCFASFGHCGHAMEKTQSHVTEFVPNATFLRAGPTVIQVSSSESLPCISAGFRILWMSD